MKSQLIIEGAKVVSKQGRKLTLVIPSTMDGKALVKWQKDHKESVLSLLASEEEADKKEGDRFGGR